MADVTLVTGPVNSGKTTFALDFCSRFAPTAVDGFASRKRLIGGVCTGYELVRLSDGSNRMLAEREDRTESMNRMESMDRRENTNGEERANGAESMCETECDNGGENVCDIRISDAEKRMTRPFGPDLFQYGPFLFFEEAFRYAERTFAGMLSNPQIEHVLVDEIGPVELGGRGFADSLRSLLLSDRHLILCVRDVCLSPVMADFSIRNPEILCAPGADMCRIAQNKGRGHLMPPHSAGSCT